MPVPVSSYQICINVTIDVIKLRAKGFRNAVIATAFTFFLSIGMTLAFRSAEPMAGLLLLLPVCGVFFFRDNMRLDYWQLELLGKWVEGEVQFHAFRAAVSVNPALPKKTLTGMLDLLPSSGDLPIETLVSRATRQAAATTATTISAYRSELIAFRTAGLLIIASSVMAAVMFNSWMALAGCITVLPLRPLQLIRRRQRLRRARSSLLAIKNEARFDPQTYLALVRPLSWAPMPEVERIHLLELATCSPSRPTSASNA